MNTLPTTVKIERTIDNEWFTADLVRNDGIKLFGHIRYKKWSKEAKRKTIEELDAIDEPVYAFIHNQQHYKYLTRLGFRATGNIVKSFYPGKEDQAFGEVVYHKGGLDSYAVSVYRELADEVIPLEALDGYGKIEAIEKRLLEVEQSPFTTNHYFSDGVYTRETFVAAGSILTGYRHKHETISILAKGAISVIAVDKQGYATDLGVMMAPQVVVTKPEMKKIGLAHEDVVFINSFSLAGLPKEFHNVEHINIIEDYIFDKGEVCQEL